MREDNRPSISSWPLASSPSKQSIDIVVSGKRRFNEKDSGPEDVQRLYVPTWRHQAANVYKQSGLFGDVKVASEQIADVHAEIDIQHVTESDRTQAFISAITLWMIPHKQKDTLLIKAVFKDKDDHVIASSEKSETMTTWYQFFLLFGYPFLDRPYPTARASMEDLHRLVLQEAYQLHHAMADFRSSPTHSNRFDGLSSSVLYRSGGPWTD